MRPYVIYKCSIRLFCVKVLLNYGTKRTYKNDLLRSLSYGCLNLEFFCKFSRYNMLTTFTCSKIQKTVVWPIFGPKICFLLFQQRRLNFITSGPFLINSAVNKYTLKGTQLYGATGISSSKCP